MKKLKIAIFHLAFVYSGGGERLVMQEMAGLAKRAHKAQIFTTVINKKDCFPESISKYKIKTFLPDSGIIKGHESLITILSCVLAPFYAYKFKDFDVILAANQPSSWIAWVIKKMYGVPYVSYLAQPTRFLHPRKIDLETGLFFTKKASESISARLMMTTFKRFSKWADQTSVRASDAVLVNGEYIKRIIERVYNVKTITCPSGVDVINKSVPKKKNYLLVSNRHFPQKKLEYAIFALNNATLKYPKLRLFITGTKTLYTHDLEDLIKELGLQKSVVFTGYVTRTRLNSLYKNAYIYLYTAPEEDFGMGIIEAMGFGVPVVAWNNAGPSKIITDRVDGFLAKPFDSLDYSNKVLTLLDNKRLASKIGRSSLKKVAEKFSFKNHIDTLEKTLIKAADN